MSTEATSSNGVNAQPRFVHLHLHSEYSLLDGGNRIDALVSRVKELGMGAVAVTDHGNLYGAAEFYTAAREAGIKPILGIEAYVAPADRRHKVATGIADGGFHLVLLAENLQGWKNLLKLSSDSFLTGFYYKPRMDKETLARWGDGLIAINGHLGSSIAHHLLQYSQTRSEAHWNAAVEEARWHAQTFGVNERGEPRFYIELQRSDVEEQGRIEPLLLKLARELNLPLVADNDAHFLRAEDYDTHDTLCCISMQRTKEDPARLKYSTELYVKSPQQMAALFADVPEAIENTARIADRCNVELDFKTSHAPLVKVVERPAPPPPKNDAEISGWFAQCCTCVDVLPVAEEDLRGGREGLKEGCDRALARLCECGLIWRYGTKGVTPEIRARLDRELGILAAKGISAYFLIVWDFVNWARQQGIPAFARGSGVGTMVGYVLGLSNACPARYGLLFERFTDPDRSEYPDIDIDICQDGRAQVINYVRRKYGHVAQIITFGRLKARAAIKDVARVNGLSPAEGQRLANLVPDELNITIEASLEKEPDFKAEYDHNEVSRRVIDTARALEDHARHAGVHAAGVVIATAPLDHMIPLCKPSGSEVDDMVTQWDGPTCERVGLLKMDFLGLRTISTIELARELITRTLPEEAVWAAVGRTPGDGGAHPLDLDRLRFDDQNVLELFRRADTAGIFQFESGGMRKLLIEMKPDRIEDLIAANALFRPGPMDLIPDYCQRKHGRQPVPRLHPIADGYTAETYGIMVYQEQVMQIVHGLGDIPLRSAYTLIKAISKKKSSVIDAERSRFLEGAQRKGLSRSQANELFELILRFAGYGFNKSHSTGYAIVAYQTAYLKTYFPNQYMAALLTYESAARKVDDWIVLLEECRRTVFPDSTKAKPHIGVEVRPPDINLSEADFSVVFAEGEPKDAVHGHVRFGLTALKGIGEGVIKAIITERCSGGPFRSLFDFCERTSGKGVMKASIETFIKAGVFDSLHSAAERAGMLAAVEGAMAAGAAAEEDRRNGQMSFFESMAGASQGGGAPAPRGDQAGGVEKRLPSVPPLDAFTMLKGEKECLGFHISGHPLDQFAAILEAFCTCPVEGAKAKSHDSLVRLGGMFSRVRNTVSKAKGEKMAMITLQDKSGSIEGVIFPSTFAQCGSKVVLESPVLVEGTVDRNRGEPQIIIEKVMKLEEASAQCATSVELTFVDDGVPARLEERMQMASGLLRQAGAARVSGGGRPAEVVIRVRCADQVVTLRPQGTRVVAEQPLLNELRDLLGESNVRITAGGPTKRDDRPAWKRARGEIRETATAF